MVSETVMLISFFTLFADKLQFIGHNTDRGTLGPTYDQSALSQVVHMTRLMTSRVIRTIGMVCHMKAAEKEVCCLWGTGQLIRENRIHSWT